MLCTNIYFWKNNKKLYKFYGKCDDQDQYTFFEASLVSFPEGLTNNITMPIRPSVPVKNPSVIKSLCQFSEVLEVKLKTNVCRLGNSKSNNKSIITGNIFLSINPNRGLYTKLNTCVKKYH